MINVGVFNTLRNKRQTDNGVYLCCEDDEEVLLPNKYVPEDFATDDLLEVFVYKDSEDRIVATTLEPHAIVNEFAFLKVTDVTSVGAFVDWGLEKELLVPFSNQRQNMEVGRWYIIFVYYDEQSDRIAGTNKINKYFVPLPEDYEEGKDVELLIMHKSELGYTAIIDDLAKGLLYHNEIHKELNIGDRLIGYIKTIREDGKIDLTLQKSGKEHIDETSQFILSKLEENNGELLLSDKSKPEDIKSKMGMSKKTFKKSIGSLYKKKMILIKEDKIILAKPIQSNN